MRHTHSACARFAGLAYCVPRLLALPVRTQYRMPCVIYSCQVYLMPKRKPAPSRGGRRGNSGRKPVGAVARVRCSITLPPDVLAFLRSRGSQSTFIESLIVASEDYQKHISAK